MNNSKRNLKIVSIIILAMALVSLAWGIYGLVTLDTSAVEVPEGMTKEVVHVITMIGGGSLWDTPTVILTVIVSVTVILWMLRILQTVTTEDVERLYHKKGETI